MRRSLYEGARLPLFAERKLWMMLLLPNTTSSIVAAFLPVTMRAQSARDYLNTLVNAPRFSSIS
jgi:hypothetical protein